MCIFHTDRESVEFFFIFISNASYKTYGFAKEEQTNPKKKILELSRHGVLYMCLINLRIQYDQIFYSIWLFTLYLLEDRRDLFLLEKFYDLHF